MRDPRQLRVVHTSDVHLGAYNGGRSEFAMRSNELLEAAFGAVVDLAIEEDASALLIAGDFFDNSRVGRETVDFAVEEIRRFGRPTVLLPGNHDPLDDGRIYDRHDLEADAPNLRIIRERGGEVLVVDDLDMVVWGRGYYESDHGFRPLAGLPERLDARWHIALGHGHFVRYEDDLHRSMLIHAEEIAAAHGHWDYLAFGHWEPQVDVSQNGVTALYSGAPMALGTTSTVAGLAAVVDFTGEGVSWSSRRVDPRQTGKAR